MDAISLTQGRPTLNLLFAQSRILDAITGGSTLLGTAEELIRRLAVRSEAFRPALQDLVEGRWIFVTTEPDGRLLIGRERRVRDVGPPGRLDRRAPQSLWTTSAPSMWAADELPLY